MARRLPNDCPNFAMTNLLKGSFVNVRDSESGSNMKCSQIKYQAPQMNFNRPVTFSISPIYERKKKLTNSVVEQALFIPPPSHSTLCSVASLTIAGTRCLCPEL